MKWLRNIRDGTDMRRILISIMTSTFCSQIQETKQIKHSLVCNMRYSIHKTYWKKQKTFTDTDSYNLGNCGGQIQSQHTSYRKKGAHKHRNLKCTHSRTKMHWSPPRVEENMVHNKAVCTTNISCFSMLIRIYWGGGEKVIEKINISNQDHGYSLRAACSQKA